MPDTKPQWLKDTLSQRARDRSIRRHERYSERIASARDAVYRASLARGAIIDVGSQPASPDTKALLINDGLPALHDAAFYARCYLRSQRDEIAHDQDLTEPAQSELLALINTVLAETENV
jgi:hypothetical protein